MATDLLNAGMGDEGRLKFILSCIEKNKPLYKTDIRFLESMTDQLEWRIERLKGNTDAKQKEKQSRTLISNKELENPSRCVEDEKNFKSHKSTLHGSNLED